MYEKDTITALATPLGKGGIGVVRVSGPLVELVAKEMVGGLPGQRVAAYRNFFDGQGTAIDQGLVLYFKGPNSFTGEDVLELQGHGGPVVMNLIVARVLELGARLAKPGEFSERAFLNDKMDLSQAEAIADLIDSASSQAAKSALRSLQGEFSNKVNVIIEGLVALRVYVEAAIDFPEEEIDFLDNPKIVVDLNTLVEEIGQLTEQAGQGALLREGVSIVLAGRPNAGKSSLMNCLTGQDTSIVTEIAGTTRDVVNELIHIEGVPVRLIDTAGLRKGNNPVEIEGVRRAEKEIALADYVLVVVDLDAHQKDLSAHVDELLAALPKVENYCVALNKADLWQPESISEKQVLVSAKTGAGVEVLRSIISQGIGLKVGNEGTFIARARHLDALQRGIESLVRGQALFGDNTAGELLAEELRSCQQALGEITGEFTSDDLLGSIFANFCIGK